MAGFSWLTGSAGYPPRILEKHTRPFFLVVLLLSGSGTLLARYASLIAPAGGRVVLFQVDRGLRNAAWYRLHMEAGRPVLESLPQPVADASDDGATVAFNFYGDRYCGAAGSTCFLAAPCSAGFTIAGPTGSRDRFGRRTFLRLSPGAGRAWIEQSTQCRGFGFPVPPEYQGLYTLPDLRPLAPSQGATAANTRSGRRILTGAGQVLTLTGSNANQLQILDEGGARSLPQQLSAAEAVIDSAASAVVYLDAAPVGRLRWIDLARQTDEDLTTAPTTGSAPALSQDGRLLAFLSPERRVVVYRRATRTLTRLEGNGEDVQEFVLSGDGQFVFAVTASNRLIRIDTAAGQTQTWLDSFPEIREITTVLEADPTACALVCYGTPEPLATLGRGALVVLRGRYLDQPGWRVRVGDSEQPLQPLSAEAAWFQVSSSLFPSGIVSFTVSNPQHPLTFEIKAQVLDRVVTCFGALHEDFSRIVSLDAPARLGEVLHIYLTGLRGVEPVPDGVPNPADNLVPVASPPDLIGPGVFERLFFGLAPGRLALQQLDVRTLRYVRPNPEQPAPVLFPGALSSGCGLPAVQKTPGRSR